MRKYVSLLLTILFISVFFTFQVLQIFAETYDDFEFEILSQSDKSCRIIKYIGNAREVDIPPSLNGYTVKSIGDGSFKDLIYLTRVSLPDTVTEIGNNAFSGCNLLEEINIPQEVKSIGDYAFGACTLIESISLSEKLTSIGKGAFSD